MQNKRKLLHYFKLHFSFIGAARDNSSAVFCVRFLVIRFHLTRRHRNVFNVAFSPHLFSKFLIEKSEQADFSDTNI